MINSDKNAIAAGMFSVVSQGRGSIAGILSMDAGAVAFGAVSEEQAPGVASPTVENILLVGKME